MIKMQTLRTALSAFVLVSLTAMSSPAYADYPLAKVTNGTRYKATGTVEYLSAFCRDDTYSVEPGQTWSAKSRGVCLIDRITANLAGGPAVTNYISTGTSYSQFSIQPSGKGYRVFSREEYANYTDVGMDKGPGFFIENQTDWPLAVSLDQVGCLYHDVVGKGEIFKRETGSVWFTIGVNIQPDGQVKSDWDCVKPVAAMVGTIVVAAATGGIGAFAALPAAAGGAGAALGGIATSTSVYVAAGAIGAGLQSVAVGGASAKIVGALLKDNGEVDLKGQYAGYEWPFRCDQMPHYRVSGGPSIVIKDGVGTIGVGTPLTITKINDCGNNMMAGASTTASASPSLSWDAVLTQYNTESESQPVPQPEPAKWCDRLAVSGSLDGEFVLMSKLNGAPIYSQYTDGNIQRLMYKRSIPQSWDESHTNYWVIADYDVHALDGDWDGIATYAHMPTERPEDNAASWAQAQVRCVGQMVPYLTN